MKVIFYSLCIGDFTVIKLYLQKIAFLLLTFYVWHFKITILKTGAFVKAFKLLFGSRIYYIINQELITI